MASNRKVGVISDADRKFIIENMNQKTIEQIAVEIGKNPKVVEKEIKNYVTLPEAENNTIRWHLKKMAEWKHLKQEFSLEELNLIEEKYVKYMDAIKDNVIATEESQLLNMIKLEILMDRNLKSRMQVLDSIVNYETMRDALLSKVEGNFALLDKDERAKIEHFEDQITSARNVENARNDSYIELQKQLNSLNTELKTSRKSRVDKVLDPRHSFTQYVKDLLNRDKQERESRFIQLHSMAVDKEEQRLSVAHQYADNTYDHPILTTAILDKLDKLEQQEKKDNTNESESELQPA